MTSPFDADEFMKRSLFSSLVGFKKKTPKPTVYTAPAVLHQPEHLPYYRAPPPPQHARQPLPHPGYFSFDAPCSSRSRTLSDELTDSLLQAETPEVTPKSPQDIYREIVSECAEIEMGQSTPNPYVEPASCALSPLPTPQPLQFTGAEEQMAQCHIADVEPKPEPRSPGTNVSLEEFIKIVVTAVKEVGGIGAKAANKEMETPEEILRRKRQQNNEAAARYRKRQREAKQCASQELAELTEKNNGLKQQVQSLNEEIERLKAMVLQKPSS